MTEWTPLGVAAAIFCAVLVLGGGAFCILSMEMTARQGRKSEGADDASRIQG